MQLDTNFYERCIDTLEKAFSKLTQADPENIEYDIYRSACIKEFEIILEQSGKLLKKILKPFFHSSKAVDSLYFKDIFRHAAKHNLLTEESCEHWLLYSDIRNNTAHDYGVNFAEETLTLLPQFLKEARLLAEIINQHGDADKR
ncbi:MAG: nucleotidyltransferase substrate binding protein [Chitinophagaceae bacterium]|nr:nucleotidyltransferase substrate binding protein [Chitinophagaceae bacterium]